MKKVLIITLIIFALSAVFSFSAKANVTTGNANAYQCTDNEINTSVDFQNWYQNNCVTPTPTPTPTLTPTVSITPTPSTDSCANGGCQTPVGGPGDGRSDGRSDGLSSCPSCTQAPQGSVLGLSSTSSGQNAYLEIAQLLGALTLSIAGFALYKKNA